MKINKEDFDKLKQLDRIEYRQKIEIIKKNNNGSSTLSFIWEMVLLNSFMFIFDIWISLKANVDIPFSTFLLILKLEYIGLLLLLLLDFVVYYFYLKSISELENEYFKIEDKK